MKIFDEQGQQVGTLADEMLVRVISLERDKLFTEVAALKQKVATLERDEEPMLAKALNERMGKLEKGLNEIYGELQRLNGSGEFTEVMKKVRDALHKAPEKKKK